MPQVEIDWARASPLDTLVSEVQGELVQGGDLMATSISRPDLWEKARENVEEVYTRRARRDPFKARVSDTGGLWSTYQVWQEYWRLLKGDRGKENEHSSKQFLE